MDPYSFIAWSYLCCPACREHCPINFVLAFHNRTGGYMPYIRSLRVQVVKNASSRQYLAPGVFGKAEGNIHRKLHLNEKREAMVIC